MAISVSSPTGKNLYSYILFYKDHFYGHFEFFIMKVDTLLKFWLIKEVAEKPSDCYAFKPSCVAALNPTTSVIRGPWWIIRVLDSEKGTEYLDVQIDLAKETVTKQHLSSSGGFGEDFALFGPPEFHGGPGCWHPSPGLLPGKHPLLQAFLILSLKPEACCILRLNQKILSTNMPCSFKAYLIFVYHNYLLLLR